MENKGNQEDEGKTMIIYSVVLYCVNVNVSIGWGWGYRVLGLGHSSAHWYVPGSPPNHFSNDKAMAQN